MSNQDGTTKGYGFRLTERGRTRVMDMFATTYTHIPLNQIATSISVKRNTLRRILQLDLSSSTVSYSSIADLFDKLNLELTPEDVSKVQPISPETEDVGLDEISSFAEAGIPFIWPNPIRQSCNFHGRRWEIQRLKMAHDNRNHQQILGERKIGKSSLLEFCRQHAEEWHCKSAYLHGLDPMVQAEEGFCRQIAEDLGLVEHGSEECQSMSALVRLLDEWSRSTTEEELLFPVLYLDDFPVFYKQINKSLSEDREKADSFWNGLRSLLDKQSLTVITTTRTPLSEVVKDYDINAVSELIGTFSHLTLLGFNEEEAKNFVSEMRPGGFVFTPEDQDSLLDRSREYDHHPMALQILSSFVYDARVDGRESSIEEALTKANAEIMQRLPDKEGHR